MRREGPPLFRCSAESGLGRRSTPSILTALCNRRKDRYYRKTFSAPGANSRLTTWWQVKPFMTEASLRNSIRSRRLADSFTVFTATRVSASPLTMSLALPSYTMPKEPCPSSRRSVIFSRGTSHSSGTYTEQGNTTPHLSTQHPWRIPQGSLAISHLSFPSPTFTDSCGPDPVPGSGHRARNRTGRDWGRSPGFWPVNAELSLHPHPFCLISEPCYQRMLIPN